MQRMVQLDDAQARELERLASEERRSVDELVRLVVGDYLARRRDWSDWGDRFDALTARIQSRMPPNVAPAEVEANISAARAEVRAERTARRAAEPDAGRR